jgi:galactokinase
VVELFVPGRLCLFGEHSDWAAGYRRERPEIAPGHCLVAGTDQGLRARVEQTDGELELDCWLPGGERHGPECIAIEAGAIAAATEAEGFFRYAAGTFGALRDAHDVGGLRAEVRSDLPVRKGLSSSAAICVLIARAASRLYSLGLSIEGEMELAYTGERRTGSECGRMDQICAFGRGPVAMHIDGDSLRFDRVPAGGPVHLLIVDLGRGKDTRRILAELNACFADRSDRVAASVRHALGEANLRIVGEAQERLARGDAAGLGELMVEAQERFDADVAPACDELAAPRLHEVLTHPALEELAWGGKGVGSQGDGCAQLIARGPEEREALASLLSRELGVESFRLTLGEGEEA